MNDMVFSFAELGFQEFETSKYLTGILEKEGFTIERGIAGIPTAWMATWGSGKPVIALGSDIDCIPQASQKPGVAWHEPMIEGAPGHGEGHNSGMPLNITAALAVKTVMERAALPGTHQALAGRRRGAARRQGVFRARRLLQGRRRRPLRARRRQPRRLLGRRRRQAAWSRSSTHFKGESAHAAGAPWRGRSALDAVELMDVGWNFRREHLRLQQRSHYVITNGGDQPNVVPPNAERLVLLPRARLPHIKELWEIGDTMAQGRGDDDRHHRHLARARLGLAAAHEQADRRGDVRQHRAGRPAASGPKPTRRWRRPSSAS